jgi:acyl transferase domain-containing protein
MLSPTGRCHTFDDRADGFVPSEGVAAVVLKRLADALQAGDNIHAVIRGSALNQDGATNGITAPSALSQERLERQVYERFDVHPEHIQLVEAHGTGTKLGDPIEFQALTRAFRKDTQLKGFCALGSIKTNIGHATAAAGIAGVVKVVLALQHRQIPPSLHFEVANSHIDMDNSPFYVNTALKAWDAPTGRSRCAAVSSFGFSGTNAHVVIEEAPESVRKHTAQPAYLVVLSARSATQLQQQAEQLLQYCERHSEVDAGNLSYTLLLGRKHFNHRVALVVRDQTQLRQTLVQWLQKGKSGRVIAGEIHEGGRSDQTLLVNYGNQCIQECRKGVSLHDYEQRLLTLAELHVQGHALAFADLFAEAQYSRLSLPTYPFVQDSYWVAHQEEASAVVESEKPRREAPNLEEYAAVVDDLQSNVLDVEAALARMGRLRAKR